MQYFKRKLSKDKFDEIKSQKSNNMSLPCECNIESIGKINDMVSDCPNGFRVIAEHDGNILGIDSDELMRWGLAFHPEDIERTYPILDNFIDICKEVKNIAESKVLKFKDFIQISILLNKPPYQNILGGMSSCKKEQTKYLNQLK